MQTLLYFVQSQYPQGRRAMGTNFVRANWSHPMNTLQDIENRYNQYVDHVNQRGDNRASAANVHAFQGVPWQMVERPKPSQLLYPLNPELCGYLPLIVYPSHSIAGIPGQEKIVIVTPNTRYLCTCGTLVDGPGQLHLHLSACRINRDQYESRFNIHMSATSPTFCFACVSIVPHAQEIENLNRYNNRMWIYYHALQGMRMRHNPATMTPIPDENGHFSLTPDNTFLGHQRGPAVPLLMANNDCQRNRVVNHRGNQLQGHVIHTMPLGYVPPPPPQPYPTFSS